MLTGLQFVVIVLGAEMNIIGGGHALRAFATPTIIHFGAVLLVSAILGAPWHSLTNAGLVLAACGLGGTLYAINIVRHAVRQKDYKPVLEDWLWHSAFPIMAYGTLLIAALFLRSRPVAALYWVGTMSLSVVHRHS